MNSINESHSTAPDTEGNVRVAVRFIGRFPASADLAHRLATFDPQQGTEHCPLRPLTVQLEDVKSGDRYEVELILDAATPG